MPVMSPYHQPFHYRAGSCLSTAQHAFDPRAAGLYRHQVLQPIRLASKYRPSDAITSSPRPLLRSSRAPAAQAPHPLPGHAHKLRLIPSDPTRGLKMDRPETEGFATAGADEISAFQELWPVGAVERLVFDLALYTGAARADLVKLGRRNISDGVLSFRRQKTKVLSLVPITPELKAVTARTPHIAPAFIVNRKGKPTTAESLGNLFREAASQAGMVARLHGLRKALRVYWAEKGVTTHQIAALAGHLTLSEAERYTRAADRLKVVKLLWRKHETGHERPIPSD